MFEDAKNCSERRWNLFDSIQIKSGILIELVANISLLHSTNSNAPICGQEDGIDEVGRAHSGRRQSAAN